MRQSTETGKADCRIIDFVESTSRVAGVISTPTLFGLDPSEAIEGNSPRDFRLEFSYVFISDESLRSLEKRASDYIANDDHRMSYRMSSDDHIPDPTLVTYTDYENPFSLSHGSSGAPHIAKLSANAWVGCGGGIYVLECLGKGYIKIEPIEHNEGKPLHPTVSTNHLMRRIKILKGTSGPHILRP
jgi:ATP-dependent helicase IRC3